MSISFPLSFRVLSLSQSKFKSLSPSIRQSPSLSALPSTLTPDPTALPFSRARRNERRATLCDDTSGRDQLHGTWSSGEVFEPLIHVHHSTI